MRLNVEIKSEIYSEVSELADREGRSLSDVVRTLLNEWRRRKRREEILRLGGVVTVPAEGKEGG